MKSSESKVMIGLVEIAGYGNNMAIGMRSNGRQCDVVTCTQHPFLYQDCEEENGIVSLMHRTFKQRGFVSRMMGFAGQLFFRIPLMFWSLRKYGTYVFLYNESFLLRLDLPLLKLMRKKVIVVFVGSDARPKYMDGKFMVKKGDISSKKLETRLKLQKLSIRLTELFADDIISNATISHFQKRKYIDWFKIGIPMEITDVAENEKYENPPGKVRILHSPSDASVKGSDKIEKIIEELKKEGFDIEFTEIRGKPHREVVEELKRTTLVIDQLYSDSPMATFTAEAAMNGVPALVGGYYSEQIAKDDPSIPPSFYCSPDNIKETLRHLLRSPEEMKEMGARARDFVTKNWDRKIVAQRMMDVIDGNISEDYYRDPYENKYVLGSGVSKEAMVEVFRQIQEQYGEKGFGLEDKPELMTEIKKTMTE